MDFHPRSFRHSCLPDLISWIYLSPPLYNNKFWFSSYLNGLVITPTFFNLRLNLAIRSSWSEPQSASVLVLLTVWSFLVFSCKEYNKFDFGVDHLVMSRCRVFSCVVRRGCLLWPVHSPGQTLLAFAMLHFVFPGQICLLLWLSLDFLLLHYKPLQWRGRCFYISFRRSFKSS